MPTSGRALGTAMLPAWRIALWGGIAAMLLLVLTAMQVTGEVYWTGSDFAAAALILGGCGLAVEAAVRLAPGRAVRIGAIAAAVGIALLLWAQGAVGILN